MVADVTKPDSNNDIPVFIGSTAQILVGLNKAFLKVSDLADDHPAMTAIKKFTVLNCKTAQMSGLFEDMPNIGNLRDRVEVSLNKLSSLKDPNAKTSAQLYTGQYKVPSENVKVELNSLDTLLNAYKALIHNQHDHIVTAVHSILEASDPLAALNSKEVKTGFTIQDAERGKLEKNLYSLSTRLKSSEQQLESLFRHIFQAIPIMERKDIPLPSKNDELRPE